MPAFHIDWTFNIGQAAIAGLLTGIGWGMRRSYQLIVSFVKRQQENETDLHRGLQMIDRHTLALRKAALMGPPASRVYRRRVTDDGELDILDDQAGHTA